MRISPINFNTKSYSPNFGTTKRTTYKTDEGAYFISPLGSKDFPDKPKFQQAQIVVSNSTRFFREDLPWHFLAGMIDEEFPDGNKVNVHNFACSDGSEPYSLAICLIEGLGEEGAKRFFPIKASDIDKEIIKHAQSGKISANGVDMKNIILVTKGKLDKYFDVIEDEKNYALIPKEILKKAVEFSCVDIEKGLDVVEKSNSLVLCRNFWKYLPYEKLFRVAKKLHDNLDDTSRILIGSFDMKCNGVPKFFEKFGIMNASDVYGEDFILKSVQDGQKYPVGNKEDLMRELCRYCFYA